MQLTRSAGCVLPYQSSSAVCAREYYPTPHPSAALRAQIPTPKYTPGTWDKTQHFIKYLVHRLKLPWTRSYLYPTPHGMPLRQDSITQLRMSGMQATDLNQSPLQDTSTRKQVTN